MKLAACLVSAAAFALVGATAASAQIGAPPVAQSAAYQGDMVGFNGDARALSRVIRHVQRTTGARVAEARYTHSDGSPGYRLVLIRNGRVSFMHVDENGGRVTSLSSVNVPQWMLSWNKRAQLRADREASVPLTQAIMTAEDANGGAPAIAAGIASSASNPSSDVHAYNVILAKDGAMRRVAVDSASGMIIANPSALAEF